MYGHIQTLAAAEKKGIEDAGGSVDVYQYVSFLKDKFPSRYFGRNLLAN